MAKNGFTRRRSVASIRTANIRSVVKYAHISDTYAKIGITGLPPLRDPNKVKRGTCMDLSDGARMRLLREIARINWKEHSSGCFVTVTYPDEVAYEHYAVMTSHRHQLMRDMEKQTGAEMPMLWRKEWKERRSGRFEGLMAPHFHLAVLGRCKATERSVNESWKRIVAYRGVIQTKVKQLKSGEHAALYMAKYLTKEEHPSSLDNASYLNSTGRGWGWHRKQLLHRNPERRFTKLTWEQYDMLLNHCLKVLQRENDLPCIGATVLGLMAKLIAEKVKEMGLDEDKEE